MRHFFVRFHVEYPDTLEYAGSVAEQSLRLSHEYSIEYGSDITEIEQKIAEELQWQRITANPNYTLNPPPFPRVSLMDWRELLGDHRPNDEH